MELNLEPKPENPVQKRNIAMALAFISAVMVVVPLFTHAWLRAPEGIDIGFGLMSLKVCEDGACTTIGNKELIDQYNDAAPKSEEKGPMFWLMGYATLGFGLLAAASLIVAGVTLGQGKLMIRPFAPTSTAMVFLFLALVTSCVFVATNPTRGGFQIMTLGVGWAFWVFGIGTVLGIVAAPMIIKFKPVEHDHFSV